uniref:NB-ARC domain containing protein n=1 Tax=Solanum tuberosum TaxID=4113 RepID=M1DEP8_SOLTU
MRRQDISNGSKDLLCSNNFDALFKATGKYGNTMTPTLYISNPEVAKIIQENQDVMLLKSNPTIKPFMATLNTSTHKISPPSLESLSESRQLVRSTENDNDLIQEEQVSPTALNKELSLEASVFVSKCVIAKKNESRALASNTINLGEDSLGEDEEDNILDICFDRVSMEHDISPRQQRSESNKNKNETHGRQHSWDGKVTEEFVPRHLSKR